MFYIYCDDLNIIENLIKLNNDEDYFGELYFIIDYNGIFEVNGYNMNIDGYIDFFDPNIKIKGNLLDIYIPK